jgi:sugar O-acyltransferase (sialic acid O-acetyltransferase NeuD family)
MTSRLVSGDEVILVGAGAFAEEIADLAEDHGVVVRALIEGLDPSRATMDGATPVLWVDAQREFRPDLPIVPAIGSPKRWELVERLVSEGRSLATLVHPSATVSRTVVLEPGCVIFPHVVIGVRSHVGKGTILNRGSLIGHHTRLGSHVFVGPGANVAGKVVVGDRVHIGLASVVRDGIQVGDDAVVGAGAVVVGEVASGTTVIGVPAKPMRRD